MEENLKKYFGGYTSDDSTIEIKCVIELYCQTSIELNVYLLITARTFVLATEL